MNGTRQRRTLVWVPNPEESVAKFGDYGRTGLGPLAWPTPHTLGFCPAPTGKAVNSGSSSQGNSPMFLSSLGEQVRRAHGQRGTMAVLSVIQLSESCHWLSRLGNCGRTGGTCSLPLREGLQHTGSMSWLKNYFWFSIRKDIGQKKPSLRF